MNVYDWDNTIYRGDSTADFVLWLYVHRPLTLLSVFSDRWMRHPIWSAPDEEADLQAEPLSYVHLCQRYGWNSR